MKSNNIGLNIVGYTEAPSGLGEAVRLNIQAAEKHNIPLNIINYEKVKYKTSYEYSFKYTVNLVQISLNDLDRFFSVIEPDFFIDKYSILFLIWESEYIPLNLKKNVNLFNELWTASTYCKELFQKVYSGPIITVPHPVEVNLKPIQNQKPFPFFNKSEFNFLFIFSYHSSIERKNPFFLIEAFSKAFDGYDNVVLVIKTSGAEKFKQPERNLQQFASSKNNIKIINMDMDKNSINHLINDSDCYVSLHHSEGFGLTLAEAMYLGKPTLATNYSGNTEFMNENNSFLVDYELGFIVNPDINFSSKTIWANPLIHDAINKLKEVYENKPLRNQKATNAKLFVKEKLSFDSVGLIMRDRLNYIYNNLDDLSINDKRQAYLLNQLQQAKSEIVQLEREVRRMKKNVVINSILVLKNSVRTLKGKK